MQLTCVNETLSAGLSRVGRAASPRATAMPILGHVLLDATNDTLTLAASNLEWHIVQRIPAVVTDPGRVTVPALAFSEWIKTLPPGTTSELTLDATSLTLSVTGDPASARFRGLDATSFPLLPEPDADSVEVEAADLRTALTRVAFAASDDAAHPVLTAVLAQFAGQTLTLAAVDGFRLSEARIPLATPVAAPFDILIPAPVLAEVQRLLGREGTVRLAITDLRDRLALHFGATSIVSQALAGTYPNYRAVIPSSTATEAMLERAAVLHACQRARIFARDVGGLVRLHLDDAGLTVTAESDTGGNGSTVVPVVTHQGPALDIAFRVDFLIEALAALDTSLVGLRFNNALQPGVIGLADVDSYVHVVMPMQLTANERKSE
ncbi:MAG TPA: DNA polymerase III subunit beta [Anaerolineae bacterium]|nr:DNA polymerase III subunit beta [Anaerolineae bacterium]HQI83349.1 DNA polymerase III subunit beta [Anaerolineae bacterium]